MKTWTANELAKIGTADELEISSLRADDTLRKPVTIWVVRVGDDLYVRSVNGRDSGWFRGVQTRHEGQIHSGGITKDVAFEEIGTADPINSQIETTYTTKYRRYDKRYVEPLFRPGARSATIKLIPR
jgi:hypothetical protein